VPLRQAHDLATIFDRKESQRLLAAKGSPRFGRKKRVADANYGEDGPDTYE